MENKTDTERLKVAMALLNQVRFEPRFSPQIKRLAEETWLEYMTSRPEVVAEARKALADLEYKPTESVSALINATVQMNAAMDVARGVDPANVDGLNGVDDRGFDR